MDISNSNSKKKQELLEAETKLVQGQERDPKAKFVKQTDVLKIIDRVIAQSSALLSSPTIRSAEARAMLNGVKDAVSKL